MKKGMPFIWHFSGLLVLAAILVVYFLSSPNLIYVNRLGAFQTWLENFQASESLKPVRVKLLGIFPGKRFSYEYPSEYYIETKEETKRREFKIVRLLELIKTANLELVSGIDTEDEAIGVIEVDTGKRQFYFNILDEDYKRKAAIQVFVKLMETYSENEIAELNNEVENEDT